MEILPQEISPSEILFRNITKGQCILRDCNTEKSRGSIGQSMGLSLEKLISGQPKEEMAIREQREINHIAEQRHDSLIYRGGKQFWPIVRDDYS